MSDVERLLSEYIAEHREHGDADPRAYLEQVAGLDRCELAALIDAYLARAPRRDWDPQAFRESGTVRQVEALSRAVAGESGLWPSLLPRLRERARLRRTEVVGRLAAALGVAGREEKVGLYFHEMEQGSLPAEGVSDSVLEALGRILGETAAALRDAGRPLGPGGPSAAPPAAAAPPGAAFTRTARAPEGMQPRDSPAEPHAAPPEREQGAPAWDEVDELFRGRR
jgi:hypothetical protein